MVGARFLYSNRRSYAQLVAAGFNPGRKYGYHAYWGIVFVLLMYVAYRSMLSHLTCVYRENFNWLDDPFEEYKYVRIHNIDSNSTTGDMVCQIYCRRSREKNERVRGNVEVVYYDE